MERYIATISNATTDTTVSTVVQRSGRLRGVELTLATDSGTDNGAAAVCASSDGINPLALGSIPSGLTGIYAILSSWTNFTTSGLDHAGKSIFVPCDDPVSMGQSLYLHLDVTGTVAVFATVIFHISQ